MSVFRYTAETKWSRDDGKLNIVQGGSILDDELRRVQARPHWFLKVEFRVEFRFEFS